MDNDNSVSKYDRLRGGLVGVALFTKPTTIKHVQPITGKSETFVIETAHDHERGGDFIFIECIDETGVTRIALPPRGANAIASHRETLIARRRSIAGRRQARERMDRGEVPAFMRKKR